MVGGAVLCLVGTMRSQTELSDEKWEVGWLGNF